jgi:hypothetical protein
VSERRQAEVLAIAENGQRFPTHTGVDISFVGRHAGVRQDDGPSTHAPVVTLRASWPETRMWWL